MKIEKWLETVKTLLIKENP